MSCENICNLGFGNDINPSSVKLSFTGNDGDLRITWNTVDISQTPSILFATEYFTPNGDEIFIGVEGTSDTYSINKGWSGYVNTGVLRGLESYTTYYYAVGDKNQDIWSPTYNFTTGVLVYQRSVNPHSIVCYGDMGDAGGNEETIQNIMQNIDNYSMVLHIGDIAYADSSKKGHQSTWDSFLNQINPISSHVPYMVCPGNHDTFAKGVVYKQTFNMPGKHNSYSYNINGIHYVSFSTEDDHLEGSHQYKWIEKDLKHFRAENPDGWLVVWAHRPLYCSSSKKWCSHDENRLYYAKIYDHLFRKYNVDIFVSAHTHSYERTLPVYNQEVHGTYDNPKATVHFIIGTAGNRSGNVKGWEKVPVWSDGPRIEKNGFGVINFANETHLQWQFIENSKNQVKDEVWVTKGYFNK
ncbi:hypothetical protein PPL_04005 [Heterostelium album PN500]|uniref:Purple acid phosphatase n=1 Tax=Heterostelium pallidum (strain ATCC 26659 / Pp 5 / PN500) TaxID=670386 RepID=D3B5R7_HETP5|nr:hypothetical protein PPL_04005 [Heterostelium album PN500]EFA83215.1 hypothetical protein PPL_04005 [Heterostelium album PN500]|eukprot:XP_020435332.1 hypothetical protein PPL_04005 [Heterostelium album PN500]